MNDYVCLATETFVYLRIQSKSSEEEKRNFLHELKVCCEKASIHLVWVRKIPLGDGGAWRVLRKDFSLLLPTLNSVRLQRPSKLSKETQYSENLHDATHRCVRCGAELSMQCDGCKTQFFVRNSCNTFVEGGITFCDEVINFVGKRRRKL